MPHSFDVSTGSPASVEQIHAAFGREDYWLDRVAADDADTTLDWMIVDADGTVKVRATQHLGRRLLPALVARLIPGDLRIVHNETWSPIGGGQVRGEVSVAARGAPGSGLGVALLAPAQNGSRLKCTVTVEFKVPLVGGKIESFIGRQVVEQIADVQRFTTKWITEHA